MNAAQHRIAGPGKTQPSGCGRLGALCCRFYGFYWWRHPEAVGAGGLAG